MWPLVVVVDPPCRDDPAGVVVALEQVLVQAFVPQSADEGFNEAVLHRLAPFSVMQASPAGHGGAM